MRPWALLACVVCVVGCESRQAWTFRNGTGLDDAQPPLLVAEIYEGGECGFACRPPGERVYCQDLASGIAGPEPLGLSSGDRYCFMGTALDADGNAYAVGCAVAQVGGEPIDVALSPIEDGRVIQRTCQVPDVRLDAGVPPRMDAGPGDAGPIPLEDAGRPDAGPPRRDAGPGLPRGTPVTVVIRVFGPGEVRAYDLRTGNLMGGAVLQDRFLLEVNAYVGFQARLDFDPDPGARLIRLEVEQCETASPTCIFDFVRSEVVDIVFADLP